MSRRTLLLYGLVLTLAVAAIVVFIDGWRTRPAAPAPTAAAIDAAGRPAASAGTADAPIAARWTYSCEQHWIGFEIAQAIVNLAGSAATGQLTVVTDLDVQWRPGDGALGAFSVARQDKRLRPVAVTSHLWSPETWTPMAAELLSGVVPQPAGDAAEAAVLTALSTPTPNVLAVQASGVSAALAQGMRDPALHERAAFVLAVFALREEAGAFSDVRATLGRLTAHMAVAKVLRGAQPHGAAGSLALAIQSVLLGRQAEARARLDAGPVVAAPAAAPWRRAIGLRVTGDWRALRHPAGATLVERLEYARALGERRSRVRVLEFLDQFQPEPIPDWGRILMRGGANVEVGRRFFDGINAIEAAEVREVADRLAGDLPKDAVVNDPVAVLNERPAAGTVVLVGGRPAVRVLDWGTWAAFFQRHLAARLMLESHFYRRVLGDKEAERTHNEMIATQYGGMLLTPLVRRYVVTDASEYERVMADAKDLCIRQPEAVSAPNWMLLLEKPDHARLRPAVPDEAVWFAPPLPGGTAFETEPRLWGPGHSRRPTLEQIDTIQALKPYDFDLAWDMIVLRHGEPPPLEAKERAYAAFAAYDLRALRGMSLAAFENPVRYHQLVSAACDLDGDSCYTLASFYAQSGQPVKAAATFERWLRQARDRVGVSNGLYWLVTYYRTEGKKARARQLSAMAADVGSYAGLTLHASQLECDGRYAEAEADSPRRRGAVRQSPRAAVLLPAPGPPRTRSGPWSAKAAPIVRELLKSELQAERSGRSERRTRRTASL